MRMAFSHQLVYALKVMAASAVLWNTTSSFGQHSTAPIAVSFTVSNPSLKTKKIDIRYYDALAEKARGYGYDLGAFSSHPVNMPAGTRVYEKRQGDWELAFVITANDNGRKFDITRDYEISREQWLQAAQDEQGEATARQKKAAENPGIAEKAHALNLDMVTFKVAGKYLWSRQVYVRVQLPYENNKSNVGFSKKLNWFNSFQVSYPVGSKIYLCEGAYWKSEVKETYLFTIDKEKTNYLVRL